MNSVVNYDGKSTPNLSKVQKIALKIMESSEAMGSVMPETAVMVIAKDLESYDLEDVIQALNVCRRECRGRVTLKDVLDRLPSTDLKANEAWEIALRKRVWDREGEMTSISRAIMEAFPFSIWSGGTGDKIGARMAFMESYPKKLRIYGNESVNIRFMIEAPKEEEKEEENFSQISDPEKEIEGIQKIISELNESSTSYKMLYDLGMTMINKRKEMLKKKG